jgi:hypothetical protein
MSTQEAGRLASALLLNASFPDLCQLLAVCLVQTVWTQVSAESA